MPSKFNFQGMDKFREALRDLPYQLRGEARNIVESAASAAMAEMEQKYPISLGQKRRGRFVPGGALRKGLRITYHTDSEFGAWATVRNIAPHASLFENGTELRKTAKGYERGQTKPGRVFIPTAIKHRRKMNRALMAMMERHGLKVTSDGDL